MTFLHPVYCLNRATFCSSAVVTLGGDDEDVVGMVEQLIGHPSLLVLESVDVPLRFNGDHVEVTGHRTVFFRQFLAVQ